MILEERRRRILEMPFHDKVEQKILEKIEREQLGKKEKQRKILKELKKTTIGKGRKKNYMLNKNEEERI